MQFSIDRLVEELKEVIHTISLHEMYQVKILDKVAIIDYTICEVIFFKRHYQIYNVFSMLFCDSNTPSL